MSETPTTQPQNLPPAVIAGQITSVEAALLAAANAADIESNPEVLAIQQRLGHNVATEGKAFALVTDTAEDGSTVASHYVGINSANIGDKVKEGSLGVHGLPEPSIGLQQIISNEKQASDAATQTPEQTDKPLSEEGAILKNIDLLMVPENLLKYSDRGALEQLANTAYVAKDREKVSDITEIDRIVSQHILAPEQAAALAKDMTRQIAEESAEQIDTVVRQYTTLLEDATPKMKLFNEVSEQLPQAKRLAREIQDAAINGRLTEEDLQKVRRLSALSEAYFGAHRRVGESSEDNFSLSVRAKGGIENAEADTRTGHRKMRNAIDEQLTYADPTNAPETVTQVQARGEKSVSGHAQSCEQDYEGEAAKVANVGRAIQSMEDKAGQIQGVFNIVTDVISSMPGARSLDDHVQELVSYVYKSAEYSAMSRTAAEAAERLYAVLSKIERGTADYQQTQGRALALTQEVIAGLKAVKRQPLFEDN
jgi:hypothetical protein